MLVTALSLSFLRSQLAQGFGLLCCCSTRGVVVCVVRGFAHFRSRAFKLPPSPLQGALLIQQGFWYGSAGFLGGPSYQAGRLFSMEVTGVVPATGASVLVFLLLAEASLLSALLVRSLSCAMSGGRDLAQ